MNDIIQWSPGVTLEMIEKQVILKAFTWYRGNKTQCSISLGISIRTLENKLERYEQDGVKQQDAERTEQARRAEALNRARGIVGQANGQESLLGSYSGVHVQPATQAPPQQPVSVPVGQEVQSMLPKQSAPSNQQRRR